MLKAAVTVVLLGAALAEPFPKLIHAFAQDADGDGRIEAVIVWADGPLPSDSSKATVGFGGGPTRSGIRVGIPPASPGNQLRIPFDPPLDYGFTGFTDWLSKVEINFPYNYVDRNIIKDSAAPILRSV